MPLTITHTPVYCLDLDQALDFYTKQLGFEVRQDVPMGPQMRWLTVAAPGSAHELLLAAVDHHIPPVDQAAMRDLVSKGDLAVFIEVDDIDTVFESLRAAGTEILQEPVGPALRRAGLRGARPEREPPAPQPAAGRLIRFGLRRSGRSAASCSSRPARRPCTTRPGSGS